MFWGRVRSARFKACSARFVHSIRFKARSAHPINTRFLDGVMQEVLCLTRLRCVRILCWSAKKFKKLA
ncbi:hypothetical protein HAL07_08160 [Helicobacter ailurogastricus]|uniref:Uncharacterized protein n=1 Tax=Helicobacter ailurogastricus TaxID=1578720 RepID=A0A0K2Y2Y3_9HELI|nr:hypothetical protein HAL07_08160 [Helicobacter ailurogastricus]